MVLLVSVNQPMISSWYHRYHSWKNHHILHVQTLIIVSGIVTCGIFSISSQLRNSLHAGDVLGTTTVSVTVSAGSLSSSSQSTASLTSVTLSATDQIATGNLGSVTVIDNRGSGAG